LFITYFVDHTNQSECLKGVSTLKQKLLSFWPYSTCEKGRRH